MPPRFICQLRQFCALAAASAIIVFTVPTVQAAGRECSTRGADIIRQAYPTAQNVSERTFKVGNETIALPADAGDNPHELICRTWPAQPELMLAAVPLMTSKSEDGNDGDVELLVLESDSLKLKQRLRLSDLLTDDAFFVSRVAFDTAYYRLSGSDLAFGLRIERRGSSGPNPFGETTLWLFVVDDNRLRPVLDNIVVAGHQGEWDTNCAGEFHATERTLAMGHPSPNGYSDIVVTETKTKTISTLGRDGGCVDEKNAITTVHRLPSRGIAYHVPDDLKRTE
ncbi:PA3715 family protein [Sinorhizobium medicae]|uniref:hypothetical protein n=1 Tax=Sinorhizobium medicae TaxID=110321 RepID=UPI002AF6C86E|nr:hypothetical protein [Sinorhizobium medicae]WQO48645.1 hypothetical protein U8C42_28640 [Sinorhizobium medicae]WQO68893.1 hypothetical protein U8C40_29190 [Sinorhizobium medicae]WQO77574.1 hypothetical protein U8C31_37870 [Sinorhizobium medicae]